MWKNVANEKQTRRKRQPRFIIHFRMISSFDFAIYNFLFVVFVLLSFSPHPFIPLSFYPLFFILLSLYCLIWYVILLYDIYIITTIIIDIISFVRMRTHMSAIKHRHKKKEHHFDALLCDAVILCYT